MKNLFISPILSTLLLASLANFAIAKPIKAIKATVSEKNGAIFCTTADGVTHKVSTGNKDSQPELAPDGKTIVFVRQFKPNTDKSGVDTLNDGVDDIWLTQCQEAPKETLLIHGRNVPGSPAVREPTFSNDSKTVYFSSPTWVYYGAIFMIDIASKKVENIHTGNHPTVIRTGKYAGNITVYRSEHITKEEPNAPGEFYSYYEMQKWMLSPTGKFLKTLPCKKECER